MRILLDTRPSEGGYRIIVKRNGVSTMRRVGPADSNDQRRFW